MKILVINPFGIGDVIFSTPLIEILKRRFPDSFIGYICNRRAAELIATNPHLNRIFTYEKDEYREELKRSRIGFIRKIFGFLKDIRKERFDVSIDLSLNYQFSMFMALIGVKKRVGFNYRNRGKFLTDKVDIEGFDYRHVVDYYLDVLKLLDIDVSIRDVKTRIYVSDEDAGFADRILKDSGIKKEDLIIGMVPGCGESWGADAEYRRWDRKNFALLADLLTERYNAKIVLFGNLRENDISVEVEKAVKSRIVNLCGKTSIGEFLGILKRCGVVVTNDGGPLHMAVAVGAKTVSIFGPVDEITYGPYRDDYNHIVLSRHDLTCRPCYRKFKYKKCENRRCLDLIPVEEVAGAVGKILSR